MVRSSLFLLVLMLVLFGCQDGEQPADENNKSVNSIRPWKLVCLGGTNTIGHNVEPEQAYPTHLAELLSQPNQVVKVVNAGITGETVTGAAARISWILQQRIDALLLALGEDIDGQNLTPAHQVESWQQLLGTIRAAYPQLPIYILDMSVRNANAAVSWTDLAKKYEVVILEQDWRRHLSGNRELLDESGHAELAKWLATELQELPERYYDQNSR